MPELLQPLWADCICDLIHIYRKVLVRYHVYICTYTAFIMNGDPATMQLLREIDENELIQKYMQEVSQNIHEVLHRISVFQSLSVIPSPCITYRQRCILRDYQSSMLLMLKLGSTQNVVNSGSVLSNHVADVLLTGNIRERCTVFFNMFMHNKKNNIFEFLLLCSQNTKNRVQWNTVRECHSNLGPIIKFQMPSCIDMDKFVKLEYIMQKPRSSTCIPTINYLLCAQQQNNISAQDARKMICRWPHKNRKSTRTLRAADMQNKYSLPIKNIVPVLSPREILLQRMAIGSDYDTENTVRWKTGHMTWEMNTGCDYVLDALQRREDIIAGQSGHTHCLLSNMKLFRNFDVKKWTLICIVWLVGADHHSVHEVLTTAFSNSNDNIYKIYPGMTSIQIARHMLQTIE